MKIVITAFIAVVVLVLFFWRAPQPNAAGTISVTIAQGWGSRAVAAELERVGLIRSSVTFIVYVRLAGLGDSLKAGLYNISPALTPDKIAKIIAEGKGVSDDIEITVPEGVNIWQLDKIILDAGITKRTGQFSSVYFASEGRLFPETYRLKKAAIAADAAIAMQNEFSSRAGSYTKSQIIIASILEKEAKGAEDMKMVAGIIARRISLKMPLQIDATVAYGWCLRTRGYNASCDVTQAPVATEIKVDGAYNTYSRTGLPAGAISNPGETALDAALHPTDSPYLYYLSTRDGSQLIYSKTLDEHLQNRLKYLGF